MKLGEAYSATGAAWRDGPERVYQRLADVLVAASPIPLAGERVADVGAGTGAASHAIASAGGRPVALDLADGMLRVDQRRRPPAVVADARRLPLASGSCAAVVAAFSFNHVPDPEVALAEAARVVGPGGVVLASAYAEDDAHPVKAAVEAAVAEEGWSARAVDRRALKADAVPRAGDADRAEAVAARPASGRPPRRRRSRSPTSPPPTSSPGASAWRRSRRSSRRCRRPPAGSVVARALDLLGPHPEPLVRRMIILTATERSTASDVLRRRS